MLNPVLTRLAPWPTFIAGAAALIWLSTEFMWMTINQWGRATEAGKEFCSWIFWREPFQKWNSRRLAIQNASQTSLEDYLRSAYDRNVIDHALRASIDGKGRIRFYIHPASVSGDTLDFIVDCDDTVPMRVKCKGCKTMFIASEPGEIPVHECIPEPPAPVPFKKGL